MKYNLKNIKKLVREEYPELTILYKDIDVSDIKIDLESIIRHIVWFYSKDNIEAYNNYPKYDERYNVSLSLQKISKQKAEMPTFQRVESEIAFRYLMLQGDTLFEVWISVKKRLSIICKNLRIEEDDIKWTDQKNASETADKVIEQSSKIEDLEKRLFGDHEKIKQFAISNELEKIKSENYVQ
ncbi:MAG: hypothetical protein K1X26_07595 [Chitinophagales bacterium]|nr:hypothetical protein [Chitinophagales bacterium]